jgi:hypothetical protein
MKIKNLFSVAAAFLWISTAAALGAAAEQPAAPSEGERLERQMWADMKAKNWAAVEGRIAPGFQSAHPDGTRTRAQEIALIKGLSLGAFTLKDFKVTKNGGDLIVSYWISVEETIDGKRLTGKPAMRLSIWQKGPNGWQWIAHANLKPL